MNRWFEIVGFLIHLAFCPYYGVYASNFSITKLKLGFSSIFLGGDCFFLNLRPLEAFCQPRIYNSKRFADYTLPGTNSTIECSVTRTSVATCLFLHIDKKRSHSSVSRGFDDLPMGRRNDHEEILRTRRGHGGID